MNNEEYLELFLSESQEILSVLNSSLVKLEKNPEDKECLNEIFRNAHSFKGIAATMGFDEMTKVAHDMESLLELLRLGRMQADRQTMDSLFHGCDVLEKKVEAVKSKSVKKDEEIPVEAGVCESGFEKREIQTVRVAMNQLDNLMNIAEELVINKAKFEQVGQMIDDRILHDALKHLERLTDELQNEMMQVRLVPISYIFKRFPRMLRDLAAEEKKEVDLVIEGSEIGLDRTILDEINEPLVHLIKNAIHHGLETPDERAGAGKLRRGKILLKAFRQRHFVVIEASDDGRGMNAAEIRAAAVEKKIISQEDAEKLSDEDALMLITSPAFSTSRTVTQASGRGFGMNAVKKTVESFGGTLRVESETGKGSRFILNLPLSMAIIQALLVKLGQETYAIPMSNITETIKIEKKMIRRLENCEMIPYRDTVLPVLRLSEKFGLPPASELTERIPLVVVETGNRKAGFLVGGLEGQQEIVIKALQNSLKHVKGIAGATILGNGKVAMIVDVASLLVDAGASKKGDSECP